MIYSQHFFIGNDFKGTTQRSYFQFHAKLFEGRPFDVKSNAWFCPTCGEVWARAILEDVGTGNTHPYRVTMHGCSKHPSNNVQTPPGSVMTWFDELLPYLPPAMVEYEFNILMKYLDTKEEND